jgi:hypothetical protein
LTEGITMGFLEHHFGGHVSFSIFGRRVVLYGFNAMHVALNVHTKRWGHLCAWWPWYFYVSPNATPWAATFAVGPGVDRDDKEKAKVRRMRLGHNFDAWEGPAYEELRRINGYA